MLLVYLNAKEAAMGAWSPPCSVTQDMSDNLRYLAEAASSFVRESQPPMILQDLLRRSVPKIADWAYGCLISPTGEIRIAATWHRNPRLRRSLERLESHWPDMTAPNGIPGAIKRKRPIRVTTVRDEMLMNLPESWPVVGTREEACLKIVREAGLRSSLVIPILLRDQVLGAIFLARTEGRAGFTARDEDLAQHLTAFAALSLDNARLLSQARNAVQLRDDFLSVASHELKTPLTALRAQLELLGRISRSSVTRDLLPSKGGELLSAALIQIGRLTALINVLLDVSGATRGRLGLNIESVTLREVIQEAIATLRAQGSEPAGSLIRVEVDPEIVGRWDRVRLFQVIFNLLSNALKFGQGKAVEVSAERTVLGSDVEAVKVVVRDYGIGIAPGDQEKLFRRFGRASSVRHYGGMGMGLFLAREIVRLHGGEISLQSAPGFGSAFSVVLPLAPVFRFRDMLNAHLEWKQRLLDYLAGRLIEPLSAEDIGKDHLCILGRWILEVERLLSEDKDFESLKRHHASFHSLAAQVVARAERGDHPGALKMLQAGSPYAVASAEIIRLLRVLERKARRVIRGGAVPLSRAA